MHFVPVCSGSTCQTTTFHIQTPNKSAGLMSRSVPKLNSPPVLTFPLAPTILLAIPKSFSTCITACLLSSLTSVDSLHHHDFQPPAAWAASSPISFAQYSGLFKNKRRLELRDNPAFSSARLCGTALADMSQVARRCENEIVFVLDSRKKTLGLDDLAAIFVKFLPSFISEQFFTVFGDSFNLTNLLLSPDGHIHDSHQSIFQINIFQLKEKCPTPFSLGAV